MIEHLVVSTIVLAVAMLATRAIPLTARTRHAILLCGLAKFAIPTAAFTYFGVETIAVMPAAPRVFDGTGGAPVPQQASIDWLLITWAAVATLIFARWLLLRARTVTAALRSTTPASHRELDALAETRRVLGMRTAVDVVRSPVCEAPAVLRVVRPVVILPARGCDDLTDDELHALLLHELAHVARRDNLVTMFTALAAALLWFHPLVWLALRRLDVTREQACDERVAEAMNHSETYLDALTKVCRAAVAPRTAGASCMAGANIKERMEHLMRYEGLRKRAWSHRGMLALSLTLVVAAAAFAAKPAAKEQLYSLRFNVVPEEQRVVFDLSLVDNATGEAFAATRLSAQYGQWATSTTERNGATIDLRMHMRANRPAELFMVVSKDGREVQNSLYTWQQQVTPDTSQLLDKVQDAQYTGEPITVNLVNADLADVMETLGQITGLEIVIAPGISEKVTINVTKVPWDKVLDIIVQQTGTKMKIEGKTIHISK